MRVRALIAFAGVVRGEMIRVGAGEVIDLPAGVDWLKAGLVEELSESEETAELAMPDAEQAVVRRRRKAQP